MGSYFRWCKIIFILLFSVPFLVFGVETLMGAFQLKNPIEFIMYFFSSSLMILISLVGIIYAVFQALALLKTGKLENNAK